MTWKTYRIEQIVEDIQSGFACGDKDVINGYQHLRMNNIHPDGKLDLTLLRRVPPNLVTPKYRLHKGDMIVCTTNSGKLVGKSALFDIDGDYTFSNHLTRLRLKQDIVDPAFVQKMIWLKWQLGEIEPLCKHWVNQSTLPKEALLALEFQIPSLDDQRRIAGKLDRIAAHLDEVKARLATIPTLLKRFRQSILAAYLNADSIAKNVLGDLLATPLANGRSVPDADNGFPVLRLTALKQGIIDLHERKTGMWSRDDAERFLVKKHDFFVARGNGSLRLVGRGGLIVSDPDEVAFPDTFIRVRVDTTRLRPEFLKLIWDSSDVRAQIESAARTTAGIWKISQPDVASIRIPVPSLNSQKKIVNKIEAQFAKADAIEARYNKAMAFVDKLMPAILAKAFRGELA